MPIEGNTLMQGFVFRNWQSTATTLGTSICLTFQLLGQFRIIFWIVPVSFWGNFLFIRRWSTDVGPYMSRGMMGYLATTFWIGRLLNKYDVLGCITWYINRRNFSQLGLESFMAVARLFMPVPTYSMVKPSIVSSRHLNLIKRYLRSRPRVEFQNSPSKCQ